MENAPCSTRPQPLLVSLHSTELVRPEGVNFPLPPRLFLYTQPGRRTQIVALCGTTGKLFPTTTYDRGPLQLVGGRQYATRQALGEHYQAQHAAMLPADGAATLLGVDGSIREVRPEKGRKTFGLAQLCAALKASYIDVHCPQHGPYKGYILVFDDGGKDRRRPINPLATAAWFETYPLEQYSPVDVVAGPVLLMKSGLMR
ncbi:hypothetical protein [Hymenobacter saemangeumensis]